MKKQPTDAVTNLVGAIKPAQANAALLEALNQVHDIVNSYSSVPAMFRACEIIQAAIAKAERNNLDSWPCQHLLGGAGAAIYASTDGMCNHPDCHPNNATG